VVAALLICLMTKPPAPPASEPVPRPIAEFMDYLRSFAPAKGKKFVPEKPIDPGIMLGFISSAGLVVSDINEPPAKKFSREQIRSELKVGRGDSFRYVVHVAYFAAELPNSKLRVEKKDGKTQILLPDYTLVFAEEKSVLKLEALEYINPEGC
jgi:hypothetical protein